MKNLQTFDEFLNESVNFTADVNDFKVPYKMEHLHGNTYRVMPKFTVWWFLIEESKNPNKAVEKKLSEIFKNQSVAEDAVKNSFLKIYRLAKDVKITPYKKSSNNLPDILPKGTYVYERDEHDGKGFYNIVGLSDYRKEKLSIITYNEDFTMRSHGFAIFDGMLEPKTYGKYNEYGADKYAIENNKLLNFDKIIK